MDLKFFNPWAEALVGRNRLKHWDQPGATYFPTFRLADSLPEGVVAQWTEARKIWLKWNPEPWTEAQEQEYHQRFTGAIERWLDEGHGECLLRRPGVRGAVEDVFVKYDGDRYTQHAWVLMPNHAHVLFTIGEGVVLSKLLKAWKGASSRAAGLVLGRAMSEDAFWQKDYFDRLVRDREHFWRCARYVRRNPSNLRQGDFTLYLSDEVRSVLEESDRERRHSCRR